MDKRKKNLLGIIVKEHIRTGMPVGSEILVEKYKLDYSPATVRKEMSELEEDGYIVQPHTSAGRVPTERGYKSYLEDVKERRLGVAEAENLARYIGAKNEQSFKEAAKFISRLSGNTVFWAFYQHNLYYTGISNLFQQPEFRELDSIYSMSAIIDRFDEIVEEVFGETKIGTHILLGEDNPFGHFCGTVLAKYRLDDKTGLFGILGPMRMNYEKNIAIVKFVSEKLKN